MEQTHLAEAVLDRIFTAWLHEAVLVGLAPSREALRSLGGAGHQWFFDGTEHVDPAKEANAQATRLTSNTTTLAAEYARQGKDWETELHQRAKELTLMTELGLTVASTVEPTATQAAPEPTDEAHSTSSGQAHRQSSEQEEEEVDSDVEQKQTAA